MLSSLLSAEVQVMFFAGKAEKVTVDRGSVWKMMDESAEIEKKRKSAQVTQAHAVSILKTNLQILIGL